MVPITRRASSPNIILYFLINNKAILIRSMQAAGVVQDTFVVEKLWKAKGVVLDTFAGETVQGEGGEEKTTGGYFYCYFYWYFYRSG